MQRRMVGLGLLGFGAFAVAAALAVAMVLAPQLVLLPLAQEGSSVARASDATVFYPGDLEQRRGVALKAGGDMLGDPRAPEAGPETAVWTVTAAITDTDGALIAITEDRWCMDRRTAEAVQPCASERLNGDDRVRHAGLTYTFPINTQQRDYDVFDTSVKQAFPARYAGEENLQGATVYRFEQLVPESVVGRNEVPADLAGGAAGASVLADQVYTNARTFWVEPTTGMIVQRQEKRHQFFRGPDGATGTTLLQATIAFDDATVADQIVTATGGASQITMITKVVPIGLGVLGVLALAAGAFLVSGWSGRLASAPAPARVQPGT